MPLQKDFYVEYHDTEWGVPVHDDNKIFEFLVLESAQAGLSWETILKKRDGYKKHFKNFDPVKVSKMTDKDVERLVKMKESEIVRNRAKIEATINNAKRFLEIQKEFGTFDTYIWGFVGGKVVEHTIKKVGDYPITIPEAEILAKDLKERGFKFLGPTTLYAHMQTAGMVNDHSIDCFRRKEVAEL